MREKMMAESQLMLFGREFENLPDDGFDGSMDERRIFNEIFFGSDVSRKEVIIFPEASVLHCKYTKQTDISLCSSSVKSSLTSQDDYSKVDICGKYPVKYPTVDIISSIRSNNEVVNSGISHEDSASACHRYIVESSGQGVTSSSYFVKPLVNLDKTCESSGRDSPNIRISCLDQDDQKETINKAVTSPLSQESYASRLVIVDPPVSVANKLGSNPPIKPKWKDSCFLKMDEEEFAMPKDIKNDPRPLLRYHIYRLLRAAGWVIGRRKRNNKYNGIGEYVYKSPGGRPFREFHRAWCTCGDSLLTDAKCIVQRSDDMQWSDMTEMWTDLSRTVKEIDDKLMPAENTSDMAHVWGLLDPFANVVFIEKTLCLLKSGITVKAKRSLLIHPDAVSTAKFQKIYRSERTCPTPRPRQDCGYNGVNQIGDLLFNVPISSGGSQLRGGSENLIPRQDCSSSSPSVDETKDDLGDLDHIRTTYKKSRKISEMELSGGSKKIKACDLSDDDLLISVIIRKKTCGATNKWSTRKPKPLKKRKIPKGSCSLLPRSLKKGAKYTWEGKWYSIGPRTVLSWLIHSGVVSLNEVIQYRSKKDDVIIEGLVTRDGILCTCCNKLLSISEFKSHAGFRSNRPCLNLFMESGKPFTLCQLEAWSAEYKARKVAPQTDKVDEIDQNDDSCGRCGDVGELICCDNCPSVFHQACLFEQELPEGNWYCPQCRCQICGDAANDKESSQLRRAFQCSQCEQKYHETCTEQKDMEVMLASDAWFCGDSCHKVYTGLQSRIGLKNLISDGLSWTLLRCIPSDHKVHSAQRVVALKAECNSKLAVAITVMEECFLPMVDLKTGIDMIPQVMYNWGSQFARLNYNGFYTVVLEKDDAVLSVASIRIHGVKVAELPLVATCSKNRRQGMCRRLINSIEEMLKSLKVEKLVISAIPTLAETWTAGFGFQPLDEDERQSLGKINLMVFPGAVWLKKLLSESCTMDEINEQGQLSDDIVKEDEIGAGICCDDPENLQYCNGHTLQDRKPSCQNSSVQETNDTTKNSDNTGSIEDKNLDISPNQPSEHDEGANISREPRLQHSENVQQNQKPVILRDELSDEYSRRVQDCGILHSPVF